jgi:predicted RNA-binding Zn ribbon-like protein
VPGPERFITVGNHAATDLVNTSLVAYGELGEALDSADALVEWCRLLGISDADPRTCSAAAAARAVEFARRLRRAVRAALRDASSIVGVNEVLLAVPGRVHVDPVTGATSLRAVDPADQLALDLAVAVTDIFHHDMSRVRRCASDRCVLMFLDTSKTGRRRWCDMGICGNRAKVASHHARTKQRGSTDRARD